FRFNTKHSPVFNGRNTKRLRIRIHRSKIGEVNTWMEESKMREAVIVEAVRTATGKRNGQLSEMRADVLAAKPLAEVVKRTGIDPAIIEDVIMGCVSQVGEQSFDIARLAALTAGYPVEVPGTTIDRQCGSSQQAVHFAAQAIMSGDMDVVVASGIENMSRLQMISNRQCVDFSPEIKEKYEMINQGLSAERIADKWRFSREQLDAFALNSHQKAVQAIKEGRFNHEIMPLDVTLPDGTKTVAKQDEGPREDSDMEALGSLKPPFKENGSITAGNASQISDGANAILLMSREKAESLGLKPKYKVLARSVVGSDPTLMLTGPIPATEKVLEKAG